MANIKATTVITSLIKNNIHNVIYDYSREIKKLNDNINQLMNNTYSKAEVDNLIANLSGGSSIDLSNYYTISQADSLFLKQSDLNAKMSEFTYSKDTLMPKAGVTGYVQSYTYSKAEVDNKLANISSGGTIDLSSYATVTQLTALDTKFDNLLDNYVSNNELTGYGYLTETKAAKTYATTSQLNSYVLTSVLEDKQYVTITVLNTTIDTLKSSLTLEATSFPAHFYDKNKEEFRTETGITSAKLKENGEYLITKSYADATYAPIGSSSSTDTIQVVLPSGRYTSEWTCEKQGYIGTDSDKYYIGVATGTTTNYDYTDTTRNKYKTLITQQYLDEKYYTSAQTDTRIQNSTKNISTDVSTLKDYYKYNKQHYITIGWNEKDDGFSEIPVSEYSTEELLTGTLEDVAFTVRCAANYTLNFDFINTLAQSGGGQPYNFYLSPGVYEIDPDSNVYPRFRLILSCKDTAIAPVNYIIGAGWYLEGEYVGSDETVSIDAGQRVLLDVDLALMNITVTKTTQIPSSRILTYTTTDNKIWTPGGTTWYESNTYSDGKGTIILKEDTVNTTSNMSKFYALTGDNLKTISIPNIVGVVGYGEIGKDYPLFVSCPNLTTVTLGDEINVVNYLFYDCPKLNEVIVKTGNANLSSDNSKYLISKDGKNLYWGVNANGIPSTVTTIKCGAFAYNENNTDIILQDNITTIEDYAFSNNSILTSVEISDSITSIGEYCFVGCTNLTDMTINATTPPTASSNTFYGLKDQLTITVPSSAYDTYVSNNWKTYATIASNAGTPEISYQDKIDVIQIVKDKKSTEGYVTYITSDQQRQSTSIKEKSSSRASSESNHTFTATPCKHGEFEMPTLGEWPYSIFPDGNKVTVMGIYPSSWSTNGTNSMTFANMQNLTLLYIYSSIPWVWDDSPKMFGESSSSSSLYYKITTGALTVYTTETFISNAKTDTYNWPSAITEKLQAFS